MYTSVYSRQSHCLFFPVYKWKLHTFFYLCFSPHTLICKDLFRSAKSHAPVTSNDFCLFCWIFLITWIPLTHELQKWIQEGLFCFHSTIPHRTSQGDNVLWYQTRILFFYSTKCFLITESDMLVLWGTKSFTNPVDPLFLGTWNIFKYLLQNIVLSCLFELNPCN